MRTYNRRVQGFTLVELLISLAMVGIILVTLTTIFVTQTRVSERAQDRNEVDSSLRAVAEVVTQDLQQAGAVATFDGVNQPDYFSPVLGPNCSRSSRDGCVLVNVGGVDLSVYYVTSLVRPVAGSWSRGTSVCRRIDYRIQDDELFRRDVPCSDTSTGFADFSFVAGVDALDVSFICHNPELPTDQISDCYSATTYPREASVLISGHANSARNESQVTVKISTPLPNLRPPVNYEQVPIPPTETGETT